MYEPIVALKIAASAALDAERRLAEMHATYLAALREGRLSPSRTTTCNARVGTEAQRYADAKAAPRVACRAYLDPSYQ